MTPTQAFAQAREFLMTHREDYEAAYSGFEWPKLDQFNWALDWFDARRATTAQRFGWWTRTAASSGCRSPSCPCARTASQLPPRPGRERGDRILLMLGNVVPLWEVMLASIKLGSVVIPATTLLARDDLLDRFERGGVRRGRRIGGRRQIRRHRGRLHPHRRAARRPAGPAWRRPIRRAPSSPRTGRRWRTTRSCSTSLPAPPPSRSWSSTATRVIRSAICRPCTGWG